jgi:alkylation response protein AidB-like acyl-CoA dehydrogenase
MGEDEVGSAGAGWATEVAEGWRAARAERQIRRHLEPVDFAALRDAGFLRMAVPVDEGGSWRDTATSTRPVCEVLRTLAGGDPSVALVASMHPAVLAFWLTVPDPTEPAWEAQRRSVFASAAAGEQWGTITSEPGSGGDIARTRSTAVPADDVAAFVDGRPYRVSGDKHFGSGSGIAHRMMTTAVPEGEDAPTIFVLDVDGRPWDGSAGLRLVAEWDGMGMQATQSHAMRLEGAPAIRFGTDRPLEQITRAAAPVISTLFVAVVLGILDEAVGVAREQLRARADGLRAYERVEWARAEQDHWLAQQAYEGALRAVESGDPVRSLHAALRAKQGIAELAEPLLLRLTRVLGGGTFSARSPFAHWLEDVRALGFLRPPWGLAYDQLFATSFDVP